MILHVFHCSEMMSYHLVGANFSHGFMTLICTSNMYTVTIKLILFHFLNNFVILL